MNHNFIADTESRLDIFISSKLEDLSRSQIKKLIEQGYIIVNDETVKVSYKVKIDDEIEVTIPAPEEPSIEPQDLDIEIVYQDSDVAVVNKPNHMVVHPAVGNVNGTLVNALMYHIKDLSGINGVLRPGIVHRIDKDTTGLLMVAKNDNAHTKLVDQLVKKSVTRKYVALVHGLIPHNSGKINAPIGRNKIDRKLMDVVDGGKDAVTRFNVIDRFKDHTLIECVLETGRTHQIRVHMKYIGFPLLGDPQYGRKKDDFEHGQYLHAKTLGFIHPTTNEYIEFSQELPDFYQAKIDELKAEL